MSHPGIRATTKLICDRFVWPSIRKDCRNWTRSCIPCQKSKVTRHVSTPLGDFVTPSQRFSHVHVDLIGPLPLSKSCRYCLTVIDRFTRWPEAYPLEQITAESVTRAFVSCWISRFGSPHKLTCDRGTQFTSSIFRDLAQQFGIKIQFTCSWHPQANGMVERFHRQLKAAIMANNNPDWSEALPLVLLGIRSAFKEDLMASAADLVYGEPLRLPGEFLAAPTNNTQSSDPKELVTQLRRHMARIRPKPASRHDKPGSFVFKDLVDCSHVFLRQDSSRKSLQPPYTGPYEVVSRDEKTITIHIQGKEVKVSMDRVKPAYILADDAKDQGSSREHPVPAREKNKRPQHHQPLTLPIYKTRSGRPIRPRVRFEP